MDPRTCSCGLVDIKCDFCQDPMGAISTDDLLDKLPDHLHLARNNSAPEHDRFRMYNPAIGDYLGPGFSTARQCLIYTIKRLEDELRKWSNG